MPRLLGIKSIHRADVFNTLLFTIVSNRVGNRPGRVEPRAVKRRRKPFPALNNERKIEQNRILRKRKGQHCLQDACA